MIEIQNCYINLRYVMMWETDYVSTEVDIFTIDLYFPGREDPKVFVYRNKTEWERDVKRLKAAWEKLKNEA